MSIKLLYTLVGCVLLTLPKLVFGQAASLGTTSSFALFTANGALTNTGASTLTGDIGTNVGDISGFNTALVTGSTRLAGSSESIQAAADVVTLFNSLASNTCGTIIASELGGQTLSPGVSCQNTASPTNLTGTLTLSGAGIYIIRLSSALVTSTAASIVLTNGAIASNVFFQIDGAATLGTGTTFKGTIVASGAITLNTSNLQGRALSTTGAITVNNSVVNPVAAPLPVALVSFKAAPQPDQTVRIDWVTSLETNNKSFLVERSKDLSHFEMVSLVSEIAQNSSAVKTYRLVDQTPYMGTSYYRLTQQDLSGKSTVYPAVSVVLREGAYGVFPNPVVSEGRFSLRLDEPETAKIGFYGADGRSHPLQKSGIQSGNLVLIPVGKLSAGLYIITVEERGQAREHRIVVE